MKTITKILGIILLALTLSSNAQITLLQTFPNTTADLPVFQNVYLKHSGYKFVYLHSDTLSFYNTNLSLFKNVIIPGNWANYTPHCISEGLFDTDTLHIDYIEEVYDSLVIYKDNGTVVFRIDSAGLGISYPGMQGPVFFPIMGTDSGTFMVLTKDRTHAEQLYKLPGSLPCVPSCTGDNFTTSMPTISGGSNGAMSVYPNPAVSYTNIYYTLPAGTNQGELVLYDLAGRELKKYTVTSQVDHMRLTTSDIAAGTYFYQLMVNGSGIATKKIIVVK